MSFTLSPDFTITELVAVLLTCWLFYSTILNLLSRGSLNQQFSTVLATSFFSFTYALRKLIYVLALIDALPEDALDVAADATVLSEALKTFNFGIRGYYYFLGGICLFISPYLSMLLTVIETSILMYRQIRTPTALAITNYVAASNKLTKMTAQKR